jgi:hypothetical protein
MNSHIRSMVAIALLLCAPAVLAATTVRNDFIPPARRLIEGGRDVHVIVSQAEIQADIHASTVSAGTGGGLLFALVDANVNKERTKKAEAAIVPLREALMGYDFAARARDASAATLSRLEWFAAGKVALASEDSSDSILAAVDAADTKQLMVLRYTYETNPEFTAIFVTLRASLVNKATRKGASAKSRWYPDNLAFKRAMRSVVRLPEANGKDVAGNIRLWAADGGKAARAGLDQAIQGAHELLERALTLSAEEAKALSKTHDRRGLGHMVAGPSRKGDMLGFEYEERALMKVAALSLDTNTDGTATHAITAPGEPAGTSGSDAASPEPVAPETVPDPSAPSAAPTPAEATTPTDEERAGA